MYVFMEEFYVKYLYPTGITKMSLKKNHTLDFAHQQCQQFFLRS